MLSDDFKKVIKFINLKLKNKKFIWAFIGSSNLNLQGIDISSNDIDIITSAESIKIFEEQFKEYMTKKITKKYPFRKGYPEFYYEMELKINDVEVHIIGEYDGDIYLSRLKKGNLVTVKIDDIFVPCLSLKSEAEAYSETNRGQKAELIRNFLKSKK